LGASRGVFGLGCARCRDLRGADAFRRLHSYGPTGSILPNAASERYPRTGVTCSAEARQIAAPLAWKAQFSAAEHVSLSRSQNCRSAREWLPPGALANCASLPAWLAFSRLIDRFDRLKVRAAAPLGDRWKFGFSAGARSNPALAG
jgi:hypothetical protein